VTNDYKSIAQQMAETEINPVARAKWIKIAAAEKKYERLFAPLVERLQTLGAKGASVQEMVQNSAPFSADVVETLLDALPTFSDDRAKETIVRSLGAAAAPYNGKALKECYESTDDEALKWATLNTIALAKPHSIEKWLLSLRGTYAGDTLRKLSRSK